MKQFLFLMLFAGLGLAVPATIAEESDNNADSHEGSKKAEQRKDASSRTKITPFPFPLKHCDFLKRDPGYHFLQEKWHYRQSGFDLFSQHPLVLNADYSKSKLAILDDGFYTLGNPDAGVNLESISLKKE